jgi:20S proteasome subunit beta 5
MGTLPFLRSQTRHEYFPSLICREDDDAVLRMVHVPTSVDDWEEFPSPSPSLTYSCLLKLRGGDFLDRSADQTVRTSKAPPLEFAHGTTTLSFTFQGGIIVAVDSRASLGSFVGSKTVQKVLPINSHMLGTMAGGAADCSFWIRKLKTQAMLHELVHGRRMSVARASRLLSNALYEQRGLKLSVGTMILGFDDPGGEGGRGTASSSELVDSASTLSAWSPPRIFYVDDRGVRIEGDLFAVGSGSTFALSILDTERRHDMTVDEAVALGIKAIRHATFRDAYSGGFINVFVITQKDGWKKVFTEDLAQTRSQLVTAAATSTKDATATTATL